MTAQRLILRSTSTALLGLLVSALPASMAVAAPDLQVLEAEARRVEVVTRIAPAVVAIFSPDGNGGGSGVLVSADGYAVTNYHVVEGLGPFMKCGLNDRRLYDAVLVGIDPTGDVAVVKLLGRDDFPHAVIGDSDQVQIGDWAYAVGNPFLLATDLQPTVTYGLVSGVHRYQYPAGTFLEYTDCLQVDASINPGNSGGPLFNADGQLVGINGRISVDKRGRINSGAGYAISINQVMHFLDHLKSGRIVDHATLGATVTGGDDGAVYVSNILERSEAFRRGLRVGDEIVSFAGRSIRSVNQFKNILGIYPSGWAVPLVYRRDGKKQEVAVRLRPLHRRAELMPGERPAGGPPDQRRPDRRPGPMPDDQPQPGDRPEPGEPFHPQPGGKRAEPPAEFAHLYVEKPGYANWYFNEFHRTRSLAGLRQLGDFSMLRGTWDLAGESADGRSFSLKLNDRAAAAVLADVPALQLADQPFADLPAGSGGLLCAWYQFRRLLTDPESYFTDYYYLGSEPLDGTGERVDVVVTTRGTVTCRWYFSRQDGRCLGWDTSLEDDVDECRVRIDGYRDFGAVRLPSSFVVRQGDTEFGRFTLTRGELSADKVAP